MTNDGFVTSKHERFLAEEVMRLQDENRRLLKRIEFLSLAINELSWRPVHDVSEAQFSLLAHEGRHQ